MIQSRQIEAFQAVMVAGGMTAASEALHITQPAVSRLVRDLEFATGLTLFKRQGNRVVPTTQAHALLDEVKRSFIGLARIERFASDLRSGPDTLLRIATLPAMASFVPRFVAKFCHEHVRLSVIIDSLPSPLIREQVFQGGFDLGVCSAPFKFTGLASTPIKDKAIAVVPADHPLAKSQTVRVADLSGHNLILIDKFTLGRHPLELALQGIRLGRVFHTPLSTIACAMAAEGAGIALVDPFAASEFIGRGVVLRRLMPEVVVGAAVIWSSARPPPAIALEFHDAFVEYAREFTDTAAYLR